MQTNLAYALKKKDDPDSAINGCVYNPIVVVINPVDRWH